MQASYTRVWDGKHPFTSSHKNRRIHTRYCSEESDNTSEEESPRMGTIRRWQPSEEHLDITALDVPLAYEFKIRESVWIRTSESKWYPGVVIGQSKQMPLSDKESLNEPGTCGAYYMVEFRICNNIRKYFAPLNGEIKPDTQEVRELLKEGSWL